MIKLTLSAPMFALLPEDERTSAIAPRGVALQGGSWPDVVQEIRRRFPDLADRVLTPSDTLRPAFVLVVNDEVKSGGDGSFEIVAGDELYMIAAIAGG
jgi:hypothetical protein